MLFVELILEGATWGDLRRFVALASGIPDGEALDTSGDHVGEVRGLQVELAPKAPTNG